MPTIHLKNVTIVTLDEAGSILHDADLVVRDGEISHVGKAPAELQADEVVDCSGRVTLPGLVNGHCHAAMTFERGWAEDLPFGRWLNEKIWVAESALTPDDVYWAQMLAAAEMIRSGTVLFNDHYFHMDRVAEVVAQSGLKAVLTWCVFGIGQEAEIGPGLEGTVEWIKSAHGSASGRIRTMLGPHSVYLCPREFLDKVVGTAHATGQGIHLHVAEDEEQRQKSFERYGMSPVRFAEQVGILDVPGKAVTAHCLAVDDEDMAILAEKKALVPHTPITYMKLAMPFPPLSRRLEAGVQVALGTDGPGSNADLDMFATIRQTAIVHKYQAVDPEQIPGDMALRLATQTGARALGFEHMGMLAEGMSADLILVNLDAPHMRPLHNLIANLVHSAKGADVTDVMVDGRWLMRNRTLLTLDEEKIIYEADTRARAMVQRGMQQMREYKG